MRTLPRFLQVEEIAAALTLLHVQDLAPSKRHKKDPTHNAG